ncbi:MAG: hypothetical protein F7B18_04860 [Desulfurococcales archaeon]|nr:hypothetical protein [Desulfurococcales archaeon]
MSKSKKTSKITLGEAHARIILAVGAYQELGVEPEYGDIARATNRSLSRIRAVVSELLRSNHNLIKKVPDTPVKILLTEKGKRVYKELKASILKNAEEVIEPSKLIKLFEDRIYTDSRQKKSFGSVEVAIDTVVPALKLREVTENLKRGFGPSLLYGLSIELATATQIASASGIGSISFNELSRQVINVPIRVARVTDVSLPPHIEGSIIPMERARGALRSVTIWPEKSRGRDIYSYAVEADALGLVKVAKSGKDEVYLQPKLNTGIDVIDKLSAIGFDVLASNPTRAWLPILSVYGDVTTQFPTKEEVLSGSTPLLGILGDVVGPSKVERWTKHMLGLQKSLNIPALNVGAPYKTLGIIDVIKVGDESRLLSLTVARRIIGRNVKNLLEEEGYNINQIYRTVEEKIRRILEDTGAYAYVLKEFIRNGFMDRIQALEVARRHIDSNPERILKDLEKLGFIYSVGTGYYSAWTITPIYYEEDETLRTLLAWLSKELRSFGNEMYEEIIRKLIENGEVDIVNLESRTLIRVVRGLSILEKMGLVQFIGDETVKVTSDKARKLLTTAYIEKKLGVEIGSITPYERKKLPDIKETIIDKLK